MNEFTKEELNEILLVHKLERLHQYLHGAHSVCDHENASSAFHQSCRLVQEIINWIKNNE